MNKFYKFFLLLGASANLVGCAITPQETRLQIEQGVQELNEALFSQRSLHLELLKNCPEAIPLLAEWEYSDWHSYDASLTLEKLVSGFHDCLNDEKLPVAFVIFRDSSPIGVISLGDQAEPEFADLEDGNPWGGSFHVIPEERNQGLGEDMAKALVTLAKRLGYQSINFYTSNFQMVKWYTQRGAKIIETRPWRGHTITIMKFAI